jgi:hypothetical protein
VEDTDLLTQLRLGLGSFETVEEISIEWSTGEKQILQGPFPAGNRYFISRGN